MAMMGEQLSNYSGIQEIYRQFLDRFYGTYTRKVLLEAWDLFLDLWPYLVIGIIATSSIKVFVSKQWIANFFNKNKKSSIIIAAVLGVLSPLGSYVAIPLCASLFVLGTPLPVIMAFLVSTPLINPNLFFLTAGAFGVELAILRVLSALSLGIAAGYLTRFLIKKEEAEGIKAKQEESINFSDIIKNEEKNLLKIFVVDLYKMTRYVSKYFFIAIVLAALIKILFPTESMSGFFNENSFLAVLLSTSAGVPFYVCGGAAIPVIQELASLGMNKGSVLAFFISGPATKISNLVLMQSAFKSKVFAIYLGVGMVGALIIGLFYNLF